VSQWKQERNNGLIMLVWVLCAIAIVGYIVIKP
jgi:hypothetical protein